MKNSIKKGFTLVELLFVMAIIAILAGFAIANMKDSTRVAAKNSMKNDARNAISIQQTYFADQGEYDSVTGTANDKGILASTNGTQFTLTAGNSLKTVGNIDCTDGSVGYTVEVTNADKVPGVAILFDSCADGVISEGVPTA